MLTRRNHLLCEQLYMLQPYNEEIPWIYETEKSATLPIIGQLNPIIILTHYSNINL